MNANAYQLYASLRSPFARRIRLALRRLNISVDEKLIDVFQDHPDLRAANPLAAIPTLITPEGALCDSTLILDYLDDQSGLIWPSSKTTRLQVKRASVLAVGIIQSSVLLFQETAMHEVPSERWVKDHTETLEATLAHVATLPDLVWIDHAKLTQAGWDLAVALEYLALRFSHIEWKTRYPSLVAVVSLARKDSDFLETEPKL